MLTVSDRVIAVLLAGVAGFHAELVAFWVLHYRVAGTAADNGGTELLQPGHLGGHGARSSQVEMHPVLRHLELGNPGEPDIRAAPARSLVRRDRGPRGISGRLTPWVAGNALSFHGALERHGLSSVSARRPANTVAGA
jgi:hypothetical protein